MPAPDPGLLVALAGRLDAAGLAVAEFGLRLPSLDDVFLTLTGRPAADPAAPGPAAPEEAA